MTTARWLRHDLGASWPTTISSSARASRPSSSGTRTFGSSGSAADYDEVVDGATALQPQVLVTDIRMPPAFNREGIDAAKEVRKRHPGTGVVILSQYDDPEYAVSLLAEGSAGYGYLLKDHIAAGRPAGRCDPGRRHRRQRARSGHRRRARCAR